MIKDEKDLNDYMTEKVCDSCNGFRLKKSSLAVDVANHKISDFLQYPIQKVYRISLKMSSKFLDSF